MNRDVKTTNVLIDGEWRAKLCDFSFVCHADCTVKRAYVYGTDEFMSPEIATGEDFDVSADIFSFGILLVEVITSREPSQHFLHREAKKLFALDADELRAAMPSDCPESFEALVLQCCSLEPAERPTAQDCADWLQASNGPTRSSELPYLFIFLPSINVVGWVTVVIRFRPVHRPAGHSTRTLQRSRVTFS